jgi:hypothetical protein
MIKNIHNKLFSLIPSRAAVAGTALTILGISSATLAALPARAVELGEEQTFFERAPHLVNTSVSQRSRRGPATYYFTIAILNRT